MDENSTKAHHQAHYDGLSWLERQEVRKLAMEAAKGTDKNPDDVIKDAIEKLAAGRHYQYKATFLDDLKAELGGDREPDGHSGRFW